MVKEKQKIQNFLVLKIFYFLFNFKAEQLSNGMITLSNVPRSHWQALSQLDTIKVTIMRKTFSNSSTKPLQFHQIHHKFRSKIIKKPSQINTLTVHFVAQARNKPIEPPKAPKAAPFFLPTLSGVRPEFIIDTDTNDECVCCNYHLWQFFDFLFSLSVARNSDEKPSRIVDMASMGVRSPFVDALRRGASTDVECNFCFFFCKILNFSFCFFFDTNKIFDL